MKRKMIAILLIATMAFAGIVGYLFAQEEREPSYGLSPGLGDVTYKNLERFDSFQGIQSFLVTNEGLSGGYYSY